MKRENSIITTNGADVANPAILAKLAKGRVNGTLVYPNALAGIILLLFPISLALAFNSAKRLRPIIRVVVIALALFLGGAGFFWTGSKLGWLIAIVIGCSSICSGLKWPARLKLTRIRNDNCDRPRNFYGSFSQLFFGRRDKVFGARFDYWRAAAQTTCEHPLFGTGPGTFQRPYEQLKSPNAEMARLAHNDYLEQFSDSGIAGGISYGTWIILSLVIIGRRFWNFENPIPFAIFRASGLLGWFVQGIGEFGLYIPALAWTAFTLLGCLFGLSGKSDETKSAA